MDNSVHYLLRTTLKALLSKNTSHYFFSNALHSSSSLGSQTCSASHIQQPIEQLALVYTRQRDLIQKVISSEGRLQVIWGVMATVCTHRRGQNAFTTNLRLPLFEIKLTNKNKNAFFFRLSCIRKRFLDNLMTDEEVMSRLAELVS